METKEGISRFLTAHERMYVTALAEIRAGRKESHWMWYILPQLRGLGRSYNANYYGLADLEEARAYLANPTLRAHIEEMTKALLDLPTTDPKEVFGGIDSTKLRSSMTLFDTVEPDALFSQVLQKFFSGKRCSRTLRMLDKNPLPVR